MSKIVAAALLVGAEAGTLAVTWSDCGAKHGTVTGMTPTTIETGSAATLTSTGTLDEDVTAAKFKTTLKAGAVTLATCEGDASKDVVCNLPLGVGAITIKSLPFPIKAGSVTMETEIKTSSLIPPSLAHVTSHITATEQKGESLICVDVDTKQAAGSESESAEASTLAVTWSDCGAKHGTVTGLTPATIQTGTTATLTGTGTVDEDVTAAKFKTTLKAGSVTLATCEGDASKDVVCNLPLGLGAITIKALPFPVSAGQVSLETLVKTSSLIPPSVAHVTSHIEVTEQNGESLICLDVHTDQAAGSVNV